MYTTVVVSYGNFVFLNHYKVVRLCYIYPVYLIEVKSRGWRSTENTRDET